MSYDRVVTARRLFTTYYGGVTGYTRVVLAGVSFERHLVINSDLHILADSDSSGAVCGVASSAGHYLHVRLRNIKRRHLRDVDMACRTPYVVIISLRFTVE